MLLRDEVDTSQTWPCEKCIVCTKWLLWHGVTSLLQFSMSIGMPMHVHGPFAALVNCTCGAGSECIISSDAWSAEVHRAFDIL